MLHPHHPADDFTRTRALDAIVVLFILGIVAIFILGDCANAENDNAGNGCSAAF